MSADRRSERRPTSQPTIESPVGSLRLVANHDRVDAHLLVRPRNVHVTEIARRPSDDLRPRRFRPPSHLSHCIRGPVIGHVGDEALDIGLVECQVIENRRHRIAPTSSGSQPFETRQRERRFTRREATDRPGNEFEFERRLLENHRRSRRPGRH